MNPVSSLVPIALLCGLWGSEVPAPLPAPAALVAGYHAAVPVPGHPGHTYDLYVPKAVAAGGEALVPLVLITGPAGKTGVWTRNQMMPQWADLEGALVMCVNSPVYPDTGRSRTGNGEPPVEIDRYLDTADRLPRVHPRLRFVLDINSSGGAENWMVALRHPQRVAGFVLGPGFPGTTLFHHVPGQGYVNDGPMPLPASDIAIYLMRIDLRPRPKWNAQQLASVEREWVDWSGVMLPRLRANGNPMAMHTVDFHDMKTADCHRGLSWLLRTGRLRTGATDATQRERFATQVVEAFDAATALPTPGDREERLRFLANLPGIELHPRGADIIAAWRRAVIEVGDALVDATPRFRWWNANSNDRRLAGSAEAKMVQERLQAMRTGAATRKEVVMAEATDRLTAASTPAGRELEPAQLKEFEAAAVRLVAEAAGTGSAAEAQHLLASLRYRRNEQERLRQLPQVPPPRGR